MYSTTAIPPNTENPPRARGALVRSAESAPPRTTAFPSARAGKGASAGFPGWPVSSSDDLPSQGGHHTNHTSRTVFTKYINRLAQIRTP